ncbi:MAG TPA: NADH-quinone oxidoreductase subunit M, partial [Thermoleophilia bacterium]|nr:NADH-quinone oxidoreductase subunit M [Thermoleophilia bacterium]
MTLLAYILVPALAAPLAWLLGRRSPAAGRWTAVAGTALPLGLVVAQWIGAADRLSGAALTGAAAAGDAGHLAELRLEWIPQIGVTFLLVADGLTLVLLTLTFALGLLAVLSSWRGVSDRVGFFQFFLLWTVAAMAGVFLAFDLFLFVFFFEMMLVPMYFLIAIWGYERRVYAAIKFFLFTQASGLLMLVSILALYFIHERATGVYTFEFTELLGTEMGSGTAMLLMLGFFAAFAVKLPAVPVHSWLPDAHTEAPTAGSVLLAGVLIKVGAYGMLRFMVPLFPQASFDLRQVVFALAAVGIVYGAVLAWAQRDLKRLVAYTSVSHMGFVLMGIFAWNELALQGVVLEVVCHAFSTGALFMLVGSLQERLHTRDLTRMGGLWGTAPKMGGTATVFALASLGLPGLGNFVAEFLILAGVWQVSRWAAVVGALGLVFAAVYSLWLVQRVFHGPNEHDWRVADFGARELGMFGAMMAALVALGFYPQPLITSARQALETGRARADVSLEAQA